MRTKVEKPQRKNNGLLAGGEGDRIWFYLGQICGAETLARFATTLLKHERQHKLRMPQPADTETSLICCSWPAFFPFWWNRATADLTDGWISMESFTLIPIPKRCTWSRVKNLCRAPALLAEAAKRVAEAEMRGNRSPDKCQSSDQSLSTADFLPNTLDRSPDCALGWHHA